MARIFISYSRVDKAVTTVLAERLRRIYGYENVWFDDELVGGENWWETILDQIADHDIFMYLLSNESVTSPYCQAEFTEAQRLRKQIITVQIRDRTKLTPELQDIHYVDLKDGPEDTESFDRLFAAVERQSQNVKRHRPLWRKRTPRPATVDPEPESVDRPDIDTPTLYPASASGWAAWSPPVKAAVITGVFVLIAAVIGILPTLLEDNPAPVPPTTIIAGVPTDTATATIPAPTDTLVPSPTQSPTLSDALVALTDQAGTVMAQAQDTQTAQVQHTETAESATRQAANLADTLTATTPTLTATPTPNAGQTETAVQSQTQAAVFAQATFDHQATAIAIDAMTQQALDQTATANLWTDAPSPTPSATITPSTAPTLAHSPTATVAPGYSVDNPVTHNDQWQPVIGSVNGVEMVLVPVGCFMMGSDNGETNEQPAHEQCFDAPFWIGRYEVTNDQYGSTGCKMRSWLPNQPRNCVSWFDAKAYCESLGGQLPTEAQWEYAARGPDNLNYPWGNVFVAGNTVYTNNSNGQTAEVGSRDNGKSWVGAYDLSGNLWEWTSTIYQPYPYEAADGRENLRTTDGLRVIRGGSFSFSDDMLRTTSRNGNSPDVQFDSYGFRCVLDFVP